MVLPGAVASFSQRFRIVSALFIVYTIWGSTFLAIRLALQNGLLAFTQLAGPRYLFAGLLMYVFLRWRGCAAPTRRQWGNLAIAGALLLLMANGLIVLAERHVASGLAATFIASVPIWMVILGVVSGRRVSGKEWIGVLMGFIGVVWLNKSSNLLTSNPGALLLLIISPFCWALGSVWSYGRDFPSPMMTAAG